MKHISKQYAALVTRLKLNQFHKAIIILTTKYSVLIFLLLFIVSTLVYVIFSLNMGITIGDGPLVGVFNEKSSFHEVNENLFKILLFTNALVWFFASILSYFFASTTLRPIKNIYELQEKFVADVAHELRTPLSVIKAGSETALRSDQTIAEYKSFISDSLEEINHLITLSNDLLVLLKYKFVTTHETESVDFSNLMQLGAKHIRSYAERKNISITTEIQENIFVKGVESDLSRLLTNILKNAVDYNKTNGSIHILLKQDGTRVLLTIADTGIGMNEKNVAHIFDRFYKVDTARMQTSTTGSGLGLSIVREIIHAHKGTITVVSELGKGSTFSISLPCV